MYVGLSDKVVPTNVRINPTAQTQHNPLVTTITTQLKPRMVYLPGTGLPTLSVKRVQ